MNYYEFLDNFEWEGVAVDRAHTALLYGMVASQKPERILEIGIGSGLVTQTILYALMYNGMGKLTSVDNWHDWSGQEPPHAEELRRMGANIIAPIDERKFVMSSVGDTYDMIFVDGNHREGGEWAEEIFNMVEKGGILFAHDVQHPSYPSLLEYQRIAERTGTFYQIFNRSSRPDELCHRGMIMICR